MRQAPFYGISIDPYFDLQLLGLKTVLRKAKFKDNIQPLITIASNNGFEFL